MGVFHALVDVVGDIAVHASFWADELLCTVCKRWQRAIALVVALAFVVMVAVVAEVVVVVVVAVL